jgi:hypothetical protein
MSDDYKNRTTRRDLQSFANLAEDVCSEPGCGMTILVDKDDKERGRKCHCVSCLMRNKLTKGEVG